MNKKQAPVATKRGQRPSTASKAPTPSRPTRSFGSGSNNAQRDVEPMERISPLQGAIDRLRENLMQHDGALEALRDRMQPVLNSYYSDSVAVADSGDTKVSSDSMLVDQINELTNRLIGFTNRARDMHDRLDS